VSVHSDSRRALGNVFSLAVVRGLDYLVPLITIPYLVSKLGIQNFGLVNYAMSLALYFSAVMQYGFSITAVREIARNRENPRQVAIIYSETLSAIVVLIAVCALIYFPITLSVEIFRKQLPLYFFSFCFISAQALFPIWFFHGMENMRQSAILSFLSKILFLVSIFTFVKAPDDYSLVAAANAISMMACSLFSILWIAKRHRVLYIRPSIKNILRLYGRGKDAFIAQLAPNLYNNSATFLLGSFAGAAPVGLFSAATRVVEVFNSVGMIISSAFFPYLARNQNAAKRFQLAMLGIGTVFAIVCFGVSGYTAFILFPLEHEIITKCIQIMSVGIIFYFAISAYHGNGLMLAGRDDLVRDISVFASIVFFIAGLILVPRFGIYGAISMLVGARGFMAVGGYILYSSKCK